MDSTAMLEHVGEPEWRRVQAAHYQEVRRILDRHRGVEVTTTGDDGPGRGLGEGGERLHYWVFGGPWTYKREPEGEATGADKEFLDEAMGRLGAVVGGRNTYEAAEAWGGSNPWGLPFFIVTHRPEEQPAGADFTFVNGVGGADVIRQALRAGHVEELSISIASVVLGAGKRLFDGFDTKVGLEPIKVLQSPFATHITYRVH